MLVHAIFLSFAAPPSIADSFKQVFEAVVSQPYNELPHYQVTRERFGRTGDAADNHLRAAARRTLSTNQNLLRFPGGQKLFQLNRICFAGHWKIDQEKTAQDSPYNGYFSPGSEALLILRASVTLSATTRGNKRAFAIAGKLFPTLDPEESVDTANFFAMENFIGTLDEYFLDAELDNQPTISGLPASFESLRQALRVKKDLAAAEKELQKTERSAAGQPHADVGYRPLYPISELGLTDPTASVTPRWIRLRTAEGIPRHDAEDFRDELRLEHCPEHRLAWTIEGAGGAKRRKTTALWQQIGTITATEYALSEGCDLRLHFAHPRLKIEDGHL